MSNNHEKNSPTSMQAMYQGPIPPSSEMKKYAEIDPEFPNRILKLAEDQAMHRKELENKQIDYQYKLQEKNIHVHDNHLKRIDCEAKIGQIMAFILALSGMGAALYLASQGHLKMASLFGVVALTPLAGTFIQGRNTTDSKHK